MSEGIPEECPGVKSEAAGKVSACTGCPNQAACSSGQYSKPDTDIVFIQKRLADVKHKIVVLSGKGGVGKSMVASFMASGLAGKPDTSVGLLDIDICGPSIPRIVGLEGEQVHTSGSGWSPIYVEDNFAVMSVGFLLGGLDDAVIWRGPRKNGLIKQFLKDVDWGKLDYLIIDTTPVTSDEHLSIAQYLSNVGVDGAVIVTTPQEVSLQDVRKEVQFCRKVNLPIIGIIENMAGFVCPNCSKESMIFPKNTGGAEKLATDMDITFLGKLPLDPFIAKSCDTGRNILQEASQSAACIAYQKILDKIASYIA